MMAVQMIQVKSLKAASSASNGKILFHQLKPMQEKVKRSARVYCLLWNINLILLAI
jgi:hypothetical protein